MKRELCSSLKGFLFLSSVISGAKIPSSLQGSNNGSTNGTLNSFNALQRPTLLGGVGGQKNNSLGLPTSQSTNLGLSRYTPQRMPSGNALDRQPKRMSQTLRPVLNTDQVHRQSANSIPSSNFSIDQLQRQSANVNRNKFNSGSIPPSPIVKMTDGNQQNRPYMTTLEGYQSGYKYAQFGYQPNSFDPKNPGASATIIPTNQQGPLNPFNQASQPKSPGISTQPSFFSSINSGSLVPNYPGNQQTQLNPFAQGSPPEFSMSYPVSPQATSFGQDFALEADPTNNNNESQTPSPDQVNPDVDQADTDVDGDE
ncbi:hypothetical protein CROQUDRAFT_86951 [Cronartium quercuum f. sp. fusiforme G11]|uniref:Uncharacterized protein n=1 Tax=Cronartium quercuum f. sp. fusiforme G11 TaxID=708437 RepID=A0A9P6TGW4_9BASI|nr:hypothetical protein CROQUDRAFT_86951 [Cronartium quercuum f. sp. fusiforme G11]